MRQAILIGFIVLLATVMMPTHSTNAHAQTFVWGLQRHDRFQVEMTIQRKSEITLGEAAESQKTTTDRFVVEYTVLSAFRDGDMPVRIRIVTAERSTADATDSNPAPNVGQLTPLRNLTFFAVVDQDGLIREVPQYQESLSRLASDHQNSPSLLERYMPEAVFSSWMELPFWMTPPVDAKTDKSKWQRLHQMSLGAIGQVEVIAECRTKAADGDATKVAITGTPRLLPSELPIGETSHKTLEFRDSKIDTQTFSGERLDRCRCER